MRADCVRCDILHVCMCIPTIHTYVRVYVYACICEYVDMCVVDI